MTVQLGRPAKGLPRYFMDCGWYRHPHFAGMSIESLFVFEAIVGYCTEHATDGIAPGHPEDLAAVLGIRVSTVRKALRPLLERGRLVAKSGQLNVPGWDDHNPTSKEIVTRARERSISGSKGNHDRWHVERGITKPGCPWCDHESLTDRSDIANDPLAMQFATDQRSVSDDTDDRPTSQNIATDRNSDRKVSQNGSHGMGWDGMGVESQSSVDTQPSSDPTGDETTTDPYRLEARRRTERAIAARRCSPARPARDAYEATVLASLHAEGWTPPAPSSGPPPPLGCDACDSGWIDQADGTVAPCAACQPHQLRPQPIAR